MQGMQANMPHKLLIVAPFTEGTPYAEEAEELRAGAARLGYRVEPIEVPDQGDWRRNICLKPRAIFDRFARHDGPLLVLDADCRVLRPLDGLLALAESVDVMIKLRPRCAFTALFNVGVIFFADTRRARMLAQTWAERTERHGIFHRFPDQATFSEAMLDAQRHVRFRPLPLPMHVEPRDADKVPEDQRIIYHYKSSRAQRNARTPDKLAPEPLDSGLMAEFVCLRPERLRPRVGLPLNGNDGATEDFCEYARRFGIDKAWIYRLPVAPSDRAALDHCKVFAWRQLAGHFAPGTPLIVADLDLIMLQSPRPWCARLREADIVVAWDRDQPGSRPSIRCVGMKTSAMLVEQGLPAVERRYVELRADRPSATALRQALGEVLANPPRGLRVATMPADSIVALDQATSQSPMVTTDSSMKLMGEQSWHRPMFLRRPQGTTSARSNAGGL